MAPLRLLSHSGRQVETDLRRSRPEGIFSTRMRDGLVSMASLPRRWNRGTPTTERTYRGIDHWVSSTIPVRHELRSVSLSNERSSQQPRMSLWGHQILHRIVAHFCHLLMSSMTVQQIAQPGPVHSQLKSGTCGLKICSNGFMRRFPCSILICGVLDERSVSQGGDWLRHPLQTIKSPMLGERWVDRMP